ncbi:MAG: hydroxyacylglutathione hydrolase [Betaproteobacteria bacterium]|jgi:hydroxyacylglutathione hydrolase|nr:hydroxyacylglutathione hydrolase [Betaproteobacteria bacterium]
MKIHALPAFTDNIIWGLESAGELVVVDPGQAEPVLQFLADQSLGLSGILITHHHADHTGGISDLLNQFPSRTVGPLPVFGPGYCKSLGVTHEVTDGSEVWLFNHSLRLETMACPGHTVDHIAFFAHPSGQAPLLFCGDTLFAGGCGRLLGGTASQLFQSLGRFAALPDDTRVFCAHEYTLSNLLFAAQALPENAAIRNRLIQVKDQRAQGLSTLPSTIGLEKKTNPFLLSVAEANLAEFAARRTAKDNFRP